MTPSAKKKLTYTILELSKYLISKMFNQFVNCLDTSCVYAGVTLFLSCQNMLYHMHGGPNSSSDITPYEFHTAPCVPNARLVSLLV